MNLMNYGEHSDPYADLTCEAEWAASARFYDREKRLKRIAEREGFHRAMARTHHGIARDQLRQLRALKKAQHEETNETKGAA